MAAPQSFGYGGRNMLVEQKLIMKRSPHLRLRPAQMLSDGRSVLIVAAQQKNDLPDRQRAAWNARLPARGRVAEVDKSELRTPEPLFDQARTDVAGGRDTS
jgi:hypothetical protein